MHSSPNILRSSGCRMTKKKFCCQNGKKGVFLARKGLCTISNKVKDPENQGKEREIFQKSRIGPRKSFPPPQTRRQVSATGSSRRSAQVYGNVHVHLRTF